MTNTSNPTPTLTQMLDDDAFAGYAYAYPHKTSYRALDPPVDMGQAWQDEDRDSLFLYTHLPFCEMRCGFCNLFTTVKPEGDFVDATLSAIMTQAKQTADVIAPSAVTQAAFGGGTPSFLHAGEIDRLFSGLAETWPVRWTDIPVSFEISPSTVDEGKLALLKKLGVDRISMGVQSFVKADLKALARPQKAEEVDIACSLIKSVDFETFNLDLIYGMETQTEQTWLYSLDQALRRGPNELYLYPLYVRELTGMGRTGRRAGDHRRNLYRIGRDFLLAAGFEQHSMRRFRKPDAASPLLDLSQLPPSTTPAATPASYCCQEDGMVGLGPGARSYTSGLHYSSEYAVGQRGVREIIDDFCDKTSHTTIDYGVRLNRQEQQRRYIIKSILQADGLDETMFRSRYGVDATEQFPELLELLDGGFAERQKRQLRPTDLGLEHSDVIGPWLYSTDVKSRMAGYELV